MARTCDVCRMPSRRVVHSFSLGTGDGLGQHELHECPPMDLCDSCVSCLGEIVKAFLGGGVVKVREWLDKKYPMEKRGISYENAYCNQCGKEFRVDFVFCGAGCVTCPHCKWIGWPKLWVGAS